MHSDDPTVRARSNPPYPFSYVLNWMTTSDSNAPIQGQVAKISRIPNIRIYEVGISYYGRTYAEGKKINWKDGFRALYTILKYNLFSK